MQTLKIPSAIEPVTDKVGRLNVGAYYLYLKEDTNGSISSDEFTSAELRAIADDIDCRSAPPAPAPAPARPLPTNHGAPIQI